jgi:hypothetical protein
MKISFYFIRNVSAFIDHTEWSSWNFRIKRFYCSNETTNKWIKTIIILASWTILYYIRKFIYLNFQFKKMITIFLLKLNSHTTVLIWNTKQNWINLRKLLFLQYKKKLRTKISEWKYWSLLLFGTCSSFSWGCFSISTLCSSISTIRSWHCLRIRWWW